MKTMYGSWVRPKIAGIESSANSTSVVPMASMTTISGVMTRLPLLRMKSLVPWYLSATPKLLLDRLQEPVLLELLFLVRRHAPPG